MSIQCAKYRTKAKEELRLQIGTLRFDLDTLSAQLPKQERKKAKALYQTFFKKVDLLKQGLVKRAMTIS